jgi:hypothetical protein
MSISLRGRGDMDRPLVDIVKGKLLEENVTLLRDSHLSVTVTCQLPLREVRHELSTH